MSNSVGIDGGAGETAAEVVRATGALLVVRRTQDVEGKTTVFRYAPSGRR
jgi:hypothetical protein